MYDDQGVSLRRSFRSHCINAIFDLLPAPSIELEAIVEEAFDDLANYEVMYKLSAFAKQYKPKQQTIRHKPAITLVSNDWLIAELLWY